MENDESNQDKVDQDKSQPHTEEISVETVPLPEPEEKYGVEDLFNAVRFGTSVHIGFILDKDGSLINKLDSQGFSCAHWAAKRGDANVLLQLKEHGAILDVAASYDTQMRPIHWAASDGRIRSIKFLLENRCDINAQDGNGCSPVIIAAQYGRVEAVVYLIKNGADLNQRDVNGDTALHWAAYKGYEEVAGVIAHFCPQFKDLPDNFGQTPVHLAALRGNHELLEFLVSDFKASTSIRDKNGCTPLMLAVKKEQLRTEWMLRRLTSANTWDLVTNLGISRLKNKTILGYLFLGCGDVEMSAWIWRLSFVSNFIASYVVLQYTMSPVLADRPTLHMANTMLHLVWWALFMMCLLKSPGYVDEETALINNRPRLESKPGVPLEDGKLIGGYHRHSYDAALVLMGTDIAADEFRSMTLPAVCHTCRVQKPLRSKHCKVARKCVCKFDHFCPFVFNTVGRDNYKYFTSILVVHPIAYLLFIYTTVVYWYRAPLTWMFTAFVLYSFMMFLGIAGLAQYHYSLITMNMTTNEQINLARYSHFRNEFNAFNNPFSKGSKVGNVIDGLFPSSALYYSREEALRDRPAQASLAGASHSHDHSHGHCTHNHNHNHDHHEEEGHFEGVTSKLLQ